MRCLAILFLSLIPVSCLAGTGRIAPSFSCPRPAPVDGLAQMICDDPGMSREEAVFTQAYYALRHATRRAGWKALTIQASMFDSGLRSTCGMPQVGAANQTMPRDAASCYASLSERERDIWLGRLTGAAYQEAIRPIEQHLALQQRLVDLGFLRHDVTVDGIYGEATRIAIVTWQRANRRAHADGFLSDADADALLGPAPARLHTRATVYGCSDPRAVRAIGIVSDAEHSHSNSPAPVGFDSHCVAVAPEQGWEKISEEGGLLLLRRTPTVSGEPPLFFRPDDIVGVDDVRSSSPDPATDPPAMSPARPAVAWAPDWLAPIRVELGDGTRLLAALLIVAVAAAAMVVARRRMAQLAHGRRRDRALGISLAEIAVQQRALQIKKLQLVEIDAYGTVKIAKWKQEKDYFCKMRILPLLAGAGLEDQWALISREVDHRLELVASAPPAAVHAGNGFVSDPRIFDIRMNPIDYERHCALLLQSNGWEARVTVASGDQGTDVLARRYGKTLVLQCKLYRQPVGNAAVQEISAARLHQRANYAAVVSNSSFTSAARQLARTNGVYLLHHEELRDFDPSVASPPVDMNYV